MYFGPQMAKIGPSYLATQKVGLKYQFYGSSVQFGGKKGICPVPSLVLGGSKKILSW